MNTEEFLVGTPVLMTQKLISAYAEASGDFNPIHINTEAAQKQGLKSTIAHGMLLIGLVQKAVSEWQLKQNYFQNWKISSLESRFLTPVFVDETIHCVAKFQTQGKNEISLVVKVVGESNTTNPVAAQTVLRLTRE